MAKKSKGRIGTYIISFIIVALIIYIVYMLSKTKRSELREGCYIFEETHPAGTTGYDYVCMHTDSRPEVGTTPFVAGQYVEITDTNAQLDGKYKINQIWVDSKGRQACVKIKHNYTYVYGASQGGDLRDITFFGKGRVCVVN
jgi:hypothetical protein